MDYEDRSELISKIQSKIDELMSLIEDSNVSEHCMGIYCFGVSVSELKTEESDIYEYFSGYSAENSDEMKMMLEAVAKSYLQPQHPTNSIDYWLNL
tara:strand:+ start:63 stop:350 length:288 start_codon:yes stop_codon:yes gene_type:complete